MAREPPDHCPRCGTVLSPVDPPGRFYCPDCAERVSHHPIPTSRLAVVDDRAILLVKVDAPDRNLWGTPGGLVEPNEDPAVAAVRELREETQLVADPDDLVLFDSRSFPKFGSMHKTYITYAAEAADVSGEPEADHEIVEARYWTPTAFERSEGRLLTSWPEDYRDLDWWIEAARTALKRA